MTTDETNTKKSTRNDDGVVINAPTGAPFPVVGTKEAQASVIVLSIWTRQHPGLEDSHLPVIERAEDLLRAVLAHRDHLHAQVTDVQARNAELEVENRRIRAYAMGASARMSGQVRSDNPHRIEATDQRTYEQWDNGWKDADKFAERWTKNATPLDIARQRAAYADGVDACMVFDTPRSNNPYFVDGKMVDEASAEQWDKGWWAAHCFANKSRAGRAQ